MPIQIGRGEHKYLDPEAHATNPSIKELNEILAQNPESGWPFVERYLTTHMSRQLEQRINHPNDDLTNPLYTSEFYERYGRTIGQQERHATTSQLQLAKRVVTHPKYLQKSWSPEPIRLTFIGCGSGTDNADQHIIFNALGKYPQLLRKTTLAAVEPYPPPHGRNPSLHPFYEQDLITVAQNPQEKETSDGVFLLGSPRMDILNLLDRLKTLVSLNTILKPGGFVAIDEACPGTYQQQINQNAITHPWMAEGFFKRTWKDRGGEFGKYFYAEPFEIYYTLMRQAGFKLSLGSYQEISQLFNDPRLQISNTEWRRVISRHKKPRDLYEQIFYQSDDNQRVFNRYVLFWEKEGLPHPELLDLISSFESYQTSLRRRLKQVAIH